jgi:hypothetical protein
MFAERHVNTLSERSTPDEVPGRFVAQLIQFGKWLAAPPPHPRMDEAVDWYAGLSVDADSFSHELCELQDALRPARAAVAPRESAESAADQLRVEPRA